MFMSMCLLLFFHFFFFNATATTEIYTLSLHDALPICAGTLVPRYLADAVPRVKTELRAAQVRTAGLRVHGASGLLGDRKSTRLNSSHSQISYAVFCLKKKKKYHQHNHNDYHYHDLHQV